MASQLPEARCSGLGPGGAVRADAAIVGPAGGAMPIGGRVGPENCAAVTSGNSSARERLVWPHHGQGRPRPTYRQGVGEGPSLHVKRDVGSFRRPDVRFTPQLWTWQSVCELNDLAGGDFGIGVGARLDKLVHQAVFMA